MTFFVSKDFEVPSLLKTPKFILRPLTIQDVDKDYDAVMSSIDRLKGFFGSRSDWPPENLTKEQDLVDLGWHQKEFQLRSSFAYTVISPDESSCLGCVYIFPSRAKDADADVYLWVRTSAQELDSELFLVVRKWLQEKWPFRKVRYPGRE